MSSRRSSSARDGPGDSASVAAACRSGVLGVMEFGGASRAPSPRGAAHEDQGGYRDRLASGQASAPDFCAKLRHRAEYALGARLAQLRLAEAAGQHGDRRDPGAAGGQAVPGRVTRRSRAGRPDSTSDNAPTRSGRTGRFGKDVQREISRCPRRRTALQRSGRRGQPPPHQPGRSRRSASVVNAGRARVRVSGDRSFSHPPAGAAAGPAEPDA